MERWREGRKEDKRKLILTTESLLDFSTSDARMFKKVCATRVDKSTTRERTILDVSPRRRLNHFFLD